MENNTVVATPEPTPVVDSNEALKKLDMKVIAVLNFLSTFEVKVMHSKTFADIVDILGEVHKYLVSAIEKK